MSIKPIAAFLTIIFLVSLSYAQGTTATISGTAQDESGGLLPNVSIKVRNPDTGSERVVSTDDQGRYKVTGLAPGSYELSGTVAEFKTEVRSGLKLAVGDEQVVDLTLSVGNVAETVLVTGGGVETVETTTSGLSGLVDDKKIRDLPLNARSFVQLAFLQPGVLEFKFERPGLIVGRGPKMNVNGLRPTSNNFLLDGTFVNDGFGRTPGSAGGVFLGIDTVREFRVLTNAYTAEYGMAAGGVVNAITKSGTNSFHGSGFYFHRNDNLDARNFFDPAKKPEFRRHQFGGTAEGPINKDKTFFFGAAEFFRQSKGSTRILNVPSLAQRATAVAAVQPYLALIALPNATSATGTPQVRFPQDEVINESFYQGRIDHNFSQNDSFFGRYTIDTAKGLRSATVPNPLARTVEQSRSQYLTLEYKRIISARMLNIARFAYNRSNLLGTSQYLQQIDPSLSFIPGHPFGVLNIGGIGEYGPERRFPARALRNLYSFNDDLIYTRGKHSLKWGGAVNWFQDNDIVGFNVDGTYTFASIATFLQGRPTTFEALSPSGSIIDRAWRQWVFGLYVQDDYKVSKRLTLNLGLRYEPATVITETHGRVQNLRDVLNDPEITVGPMYRNPSLKSFAPRLGFAWDVFGKGKTAVRGGFGLFYDPYIAYVLVPAHILAPPFVKQVFFSSPAAPAPQIAFPFIPLPDNPPNSIQNIQITDYNIKNPYSMQYNLNVQQEIFKGAVLSVGYVGSRGINLMRGGAVNIPNSQIVNGRQFFRLPTTPLVRRNPNWADIDLKRGDGSSWYNGLQASVQKRFSQNYQFQVSYTFSRSIDDGSGFLFNDTSSGVSDPQDPFDPKAERGLSAFDTRHNLTFNATYDLPFMQKQEGLVGKLLGGWQINTIAAMRSGNPFTVGVRGDRAGAGLRRAGQTRPDVLSGVNFNQAILGISGFKRTGKYYDPSIFRLQDPGFIGNVGRNTLIGPNFKNVDVSFVKSTKLALLGESGSLQFRFEIFNVLNRANFAIPDVFVFTGAATTPTINPLACPAPFDPTQFKYECPLSTAGTITSTITDARQIQLGLKLIF